MGGKKRRRVALFATRRIGMARQGPQKGRKRPQRRGNRVSSLGSGVGESSCPEVNGKVRVL